MKLCSLMEGREWSATVPTTNKVLWPMSAIPILMVVMSLKTG